jgi:hypothetical protein
MTTVLLDLISPVVGVVIALWGFRRSTRADQLRAFFEIQDRYLASDVRAGRSVLHAQVAGKPAEEVARLDAADLSRAGYALAVMNSIAIACEAGYVERDLLARSMGRSFTTAVGAAQPYIDHLQQVRGFRPYPFAENLAFQLAASDVGPVLAARDLIAPSGSDGGVELGLLDSLVTQNVWRNAADIGAQVNELCLYEVDVPREIPLQPPPGRDLAEVTDLPEFFALLV